MTMHETTWFVLFAPRLKPSHRPTPSGSNGAVSNMTEERPDTDTDHPTLVGAWVQGRYYMGEYDGGEGEFLSAKATVPIEHAR